MTGTLSQIKNCSLLTRLVICLVLIQFVTVGCASKTMITSEPEGAEVYIDNVRKGVTPLSYSDTAAAGSSKQLVLKKEGYKEFRTVIRKSEFQVGPCIGGALVLFPFIWVLGYPEEHGFTLEKAEPGEQSFLHFLLRNSEPTL